MRQKKIAHGNASGVDAITVVSEKPVWYERDRKLEIMLFFKKNHVRSSRYWSSK